MAVFSIMDHGAVGDGVVNDAATIQRAVDACHAAGGGTVLVPAGKVFLAGSIVLKSNVELHVERGATLLAGGDPADHTFRFKGAGLPAFIAADGAQNVAITGGGTIDGNGRAYVDEDLGHIYRMKRGRPFTFFFVGCHNVTFRDVQILDGAVWTLRTTGCDDVLIHSVRIYNDLKLPNSDAIDVDRCRNVRISDCHIESGDDCICLKCTKEFDGHGPCENVVVTGCTLVSTSAALIIGCEVREPIRNVVFDSCVITRSHRGLAIHLSEGSDVENVTFSNMVVETRLFHHKWWGRAEPIYVTAIPWTADREIGRVRNVRFVNVLARGENGVLIQGWAADRIDGLLLENVRVEIDKTSKWPGGTQDLRPWPQDAGGPGPAGDLPEHPTVGFFVKNAKNVTLRNCQVVWSQNRPAYFAHALEARGVENLVLENFAGESAHPERFADRVVQEK